MHAYKRSCPKWKTGFYPIQSPVGPGTSNTKATMSFFSQHDVVDFMPYLGTPEVPVELPSSSLSTKGRPKPPLIAICHLNWDSVWQRPQQFISRLAANHTVLFVETHFTKTGESFTHTRAAENHTSISILEIHLPDHRRNHVDFIDSERRRILQDRLVGEFGGTFDGAILWFSDPMAVTAYAGELGECMIIYDCVDELLDLQDAPPVMHQRERDLTKRADLIFCGGRKMRDRRLLYNANTHYYENGVDCAHFGKACTEKLNVDPEIAALQGPVLGYLGMVDERIDYELLVALADANRDWSIAIVGLIATADRLKIPHRHNLHWLGCRPYERMPAMIKGFSVCLMPFAWNSATDSINTTRALEYMAAGRPVVSTALDEGRTNFNTVSRVVGTHSEFIKMCKREVHSPDRARICRGLKLAADNTWEAIVAKMEEHIQDVLSPGRRADGREPENLDHWPARQRDGSRACV
jgi:glycosyltransferase involved in cell wall biosynthesis